MSINIHPSIFFFILATSFAIRKQKGYVPFVQLDVFVTFAVKLEDIIPNTSVIALSVGWHECCSSYYFLEEI